MMRRLRNLITEPFTDVMRGLERCLRVSPLESKPAWGAFLLIFLGLAIGWWLYVPIHELLHVAGCLITGGTVEELEVGRIYGGDLLAAMFDFVTPGGEYAGRLSGFDDGGSDFVYLVTVFMPYLLTIFPGVWLLLRASEQRRAFVYGFALPIALAPFISLIGDAYELGSIVVSQVPPWNEPAVAEALRGDDVMLKFEAWRAAPPSPWLGGALAFMVGAAWAIATYALGRRVALMLGQRTRI